MRPLLIIILLSVCAASSFAQDTAQSKSSVSAPPDVLILKFSWLNISLLQPWEDSTFSAAKEKLETGAPTQQQKIATQRASTNLPARSVSTAQPAATSPPPLPPPRPKSPRIKEQYIYRLKIKNAGTKKITALDWDYIFIDPITHDELDSHRFQSFVKIKSNRSSTLEGISASPPTKLVTAAALEKDRHQPFNQYVVIRCIVYSDGTLWENSLRGKGDCQSLKKP